MQKLEVRKESLLDSLVREYVRSAEPVGSLHLALKAGLSVSSATIRNELAELEAEGYLEQPHTSAGRVPSEEGYRYFIAHLLTPRTPSAAFIHGLRKAVDLKATAKLMAAEAGECVFVSFAPHDVYYTGLTQLFGKPEFGSREVAVNLSAALDELDSMVSGLARSAEPRTLLGADNPLHRYCATVYRSTGDGHVGFFGLMRMDYEKALGVLNAIPYDRKA